MKARQFISDNFGRLFFAAFFLVLVIVSTLSSCTAIRKAHNDRSAARKVVKAYAKAPAVVGAYLGQWFPPTDSSSQTIKYIQGETATSTDTLTLHDTITTNGIQYINRYIEKTTQRTDTFRLDKYERQHNEASLQASSDSNRTLRDNVVTMTEKVAAKNRMIGNLYKVIGGLSVAFIAVIIIGYFLMKGSFVKKLL